ncbi:MAG TPA: hypothetical protein VGR71_11740 [Nitrospira sp.]|nr:hypothetical protein [Nitrospira sp.]
MTYADRTFPLHRYENNGIVAEIDAKVFGAGHLILSSWRSGPNEESRARSILIDPDDIERLEEAIKEAKRRRNGSARRRRKKIERELAERGRISAPDMSAAPEACDRTSERYDRTSQ